MLSFDAALYAEARDAKRGRIAIPRTLAQLRDWVGETYTVSVVHVVYDSIDIGPSGRRPRLDLILETDADCDTLKKDLFAIRPAVKKRVLRRFARLAEELEPNRYDTSDVLLIVDSFSDECLAQACYAFLRNDKARVISEFSDAGIWKIEGFHRSIVVFFENDMQLQQNRDDGTCDRIEQQCFDLVKRYDEFGYLTPATFLLAFDSKQNLDEKYEGSLYYYFK